MPDAGHAMVVLAGLAWSVRRVRVHHHRAEFPTAKQLPSLAHPLLSVQHGAAIAEHDQEGNQRDERCGKQQPDRRQGAIGASLYYSAKPDLRLFHAVADGRCVTPLSLGRPARAAFGGTEHAALTRRIESCLAQTKPEQIRPARDRWFSRLAPPNRECVLVLLIRAIRPR